MSLFKFTTAFGSVLLWAENTKRAVRKFNSITENALFLKVEPYET